jgi:hypothetical protein
MANLRIVLTTDANNPNLGDLYLDNSGQLEWVGTDIADSESYSLMILQRIRCNLLLVRGEWYLDQRIGTPWREQIWVKGTTTSTIRQVIRDAVIATPGVESISSLDVSLDNTSRTATITLTVVADTGTIVSTDILDRPFILEVPNA